MDLADHISVGVGDGDGQQMRLVGNDAGNETDKDRPSIDGSVVQAQSPP